MTLNLDGKIALVTGAGQGVGRQIAITLASRGASVVINDLFSDRAEAVAAEITGNGGVAIAAPADICDPDAVRLMFEKARASLGGINILVNNAGVPTATRENPTERLRFYETSIADQTGMVDLNLHGTLYCCREALTDMVPQHWGKIINIVSEAGRAGEARLASYAAAKAGVIGATKSLALEHGRDAINVNAISLGATSHEGIKFGPLSPETNPDTDTTWQRMAKRYPIAKGLNRLGTPTDVASAVSFLVSDGADFITGQTLGVSGGYFMP